MTSPLQAALAEARTLRGVTGPIALPEYAHIFSRTAMNGEDPGRRRRLKRNRPGQRPWRDYPRIRARVLLVEALYLQGFELEETQRFVNWELVANGQRPVSERTIDLDRSRMNELWRERPRGWLACDPPKSVYQPRRTAKPMDAYMPAPEAPAEPAPPRQPPGVKTQTVEDLMVDDLPDEVEPDTTPRTDSSVLERASAFAQPAESSGPKIQRFEDLLEQDQELLEQDLEEEAEPW